MLHEGNIFFRQGYLNLLKNHSLLFQNALDYETFVKLLEIHMKPLQWKMNLDKVKKKFWRSTWLKKVNAMITNQTLYVHSLNDLSLNLPQTKILIDILLIDIHPYWRFSFWFPVASFHHSYTY